nr:6254_t:CDS:2 [Entrophospora candida]
MNKFLALTPTKKEPEYQETPNLEISSVGTENTKKLSGRIPYGCALLTSVGSQHEYDVPFHKKVKLNKLLDQGIKHIIHATPMPEGNSLETFVEKATKAMQNSIILAERSGIKKLANCFLGGKIYCRNENSKQPLADGIVQGSGISGSIENKLGKMASLEVDTERHNLRDEFNILIQEEDNNEEDNNQDKSEEDKQRFEIGDFIEVEYIKNKETPLPKNQEDNKDKKTATEWQEELKVVDDDIARVFDENKVNE